MTARRVRTATRLLMMDLMRRRIALLLLFVVPALFDAVVLVTTASRDVDVTVASLVEALPRTSSRLDVLADAFDDDGTRTVDERRLSLVFLGVAAVSFLACFLAFNLVHKRREVDARLVLAGYRAHEVMVAKLMVLLALVALLAGYETVIVWPWVVPRHPLLLGGGLFLGGLIYGCLGMLVGALLKGELEGIFAIAFLTNIDAGWLQNPIYFAHSQQKGLIRSLPGYGPVQLAVVGAFTDDEPKGALLRALLWAGCTLVIALLAFGSRIRPPPPGSGGPNLRWLYTKVMLVSYALWFASFELVGRYAATLHTTDLTSSWDRAIPVVPAFGWPYEALYVLPVLALFVIHDWHRFDVALGALFLANVTAFAVYVSVPIAFPHPVLGTSLAERVLAFEYAADFHPGANKLPSMHVAMSWIIVCAMWRQSRPRVDAVIAVLLGLITVAPLFVKQHLIIDVVLGVPWGLGSYWTVGRLYRRFVQTEEPARAALARLLVR